MQRDMQIYEETNRGDHQSGLGLQNGEASDWLRVSIINEAKL